MSTTGFDPTGLGSTFWNNAIESTQQTEKTQTVQIGDTTISLQGKGDQVEAYIQPPGRPALPVVLANNDPAGLQHFLDLVGNVINHDPVSFLDSVPTPNDTGAKAVNKKIENLNNFELRALTGKDGDEGQAALRWAVNNPNDPNLSPALRAFALGIREQAQRETEQQWGLPEGSFELEDNSALQNTAITLSARALVLTELRNSGLPQDIQNKLFFAFVHNDPSAVPPGLQSIFANISDKVFTETQKEFGFPDNTKLPFDTAAYDKGMSNDFDSQFENTLAEKFDNGEITQDQKEELTAMHYGLQTPNSAQLKGLLDSIEQPIIADMQEYNGFPDGYRPPTNSEGFTNMIEGAYQSAIAGAIENFQPPLTADQKQILYTNLGIQGGRNSVPAELQGVFDQIQSSSLANIQNQFGLSPTFAPTGRVVGPLDPKISAAQSALDGAKEWLGNAQAAVDSMPAGPAKMSYQNFLKTVSEALSLLQQTLYSMAAGDSDISKILNRIESDTNTSKISKQKHDLEEVKKKEKKMAQLGPLMGCMKWLTMILMVALLGPVGLLLVTALMVNSMVQNKGNIGKMDLTKDLMKSFSDIGGSKGAAIGGALTMLLAPQLFMGDLMFGNGQILEGTLKGMGVPDTAAMAITMAASMIAQIVMTIVLTIVTAGAATGAMVTLIAARVASYVVKAAIQVVTTMIQVMEKVAEVAAKVGQVLAKVIKAFTDVMIKVMERLLQVLETVSEKLSTIVAQATAKINSGQQIGAKFTQMSARISEGWAKFTGQLAEGEVSKAFKELGSMIQDVMKMAFNVGEDTAEGAASKSSDEFANTMEKIKSVTEFVPQITQTYVGIRNNVLQGQIALIKGDLDAYMTIVETFIKMIKKLIQKMLDSLKGNTEAIANVGQAQQKMWGDLSSTMTNISGAF